MAKDPAFLFYYQDFLVGIDHMTDEQVGQYIKCICHQANRGTIRELHMKNMCKTHDNFLIIREKFEIDQLNGELYNPRLREEIEKRKSYCESRRESIRNRYIRSTYVQRMENENENEDENINENKDRGVGKGKEKFVKPSLQDVTDYCRERGNKVDPEAFIDFYTGKGWKVGNQPMKDWKACVRTWEKRQIGNPPTKGKTPAYFVVLQYKALKWTDQQIKDKLSGEYSEHELVEALMPKDEKY